MKIQRITVMDPNSATPTVEMTIADHPLIDDASRMIVASIRLAESEETLEELQLAALRELRDSVELVYRNLSRAPAPHAARSGKKPASV